MNHQKLNHFVVAWLLAILLLLVSFPVASAEQGKERETGATTAVPATVDEQQVREVLLDILGKGKPKPVSEASTGGSLSYDETTIKQWEPTQRKALLERLSELKKRLPTYPQEIQHAFALATDPEKGWGGLDVLLIIVVPILLGLLLEYLATRRLLKKLYAYAEQREKTFGLKVRFLSTRLFIQLFGLLVFWASTYVFALFYIRNNQYFDYLFTEVLDAFVLFRLSMLLARSIFSPYQEPLRLISLDNHAARQLYFWAITFFGIVTFGLLFIEYFELTGMNPIMRGGLLIPYSMIINFMLMYGVWVLRKEITAMFMGKGNPAAVTGFARQYVVPLWPYLLTVWLFGLWIFWLYLAFMGYWEASAAVTLAWYITILFPVVDRLVYGLLQLVQRIPWLQSPSFPVRSRRFTGIVQSGFRLIALGVAIWMVAQAWGLNAGQMMGGTLLADAFSKGINILVITVIAYVIWELVQALIERKFPVTEDDPVASLEGEGGGAGATRAETLLPLVRTTLSVMLMVPLLLTVLNSMGVAIAPLLAGAGVVGIAVGFGAQKLVQDILSGIFFLVDDAFRKGEYLEIEELRGTVEKISLRSMQLRHHLGAIQTIPYSEVKTVTNLSRDWITMKLELRLPYNTDIEKVRKIIKKVGQAMLKDEELGPSFILPLKSQGVMRVEESALIIRMKFTTKPGEQWVVRREAYRRVRDALAEQGIHFAHREVRVVLPDGEKSMPAHETGVMQAENTTDVGREASVPPVAAPDKDNALKKAAAAAVTSILAAEAAKQGMKDSDMGGGDDR